MRMRPAYLTSILATAGACAAIALAPNAAADEPSCTDVGGSTECSTPGNVEINATPPVSQDPFTLPYWDEVWGGGAYTGGPYVVPYGEGSGTR
jgi:hypothetical protein